MEIRKTEIFAKILDIVANETELTSEQILSCCRTAETVDARYMLVHLLRREGIYISEIARTAFRDFVRCSVFFRT